MIIFSTTKIDYPAFEHTEIDEVEAQDEIEFLNNKNLNSIAATNKIV